MLNQLEMRGIIMKFVFIEPEYPLPISSVKLLFRNSNINDVELKKQSFSNQWSVEIGELPCGRYEYRFLINEKFTLNDPSANMFSPDNENKLWSLLAIDENGDRLYNNEQYNVNIESVQVDDDYYDDVRESMVELTTDKSRQAVLRYEFSRVTGAHAVSILWISPMGNISGWAEETLIDTDDSEYIWFGLNFADLTDVCSGTWNALLFIDGGYVLKNVFLIQCVTTAVPKQTLNMSV